MEKFQGNSGDGLGALGLKLRDDKLFDLISVDTEMRGEAPFLRKAGMGGARYMRHCLESSVLERGGLWMPETVEKALDVLEKLDGGQVAKTTFETWVYVEDGDAVKRQATKPNLPLKGAALQHRKFVEKDIDWAGLFTQTADQAQEERDRDSLKPAWQDRYAKTLADYATGAANDGQMLCALLTKQAVSERSFLSQTAQTGEFATDAFLSMISARYVRTLCLCDLSAADPSVTNPLAPDLTEVGRTILLLASAGRMSEVMELGTRIAPYIDPETLFVPVVPRMGLAFATQRDDLLDTDEQTFGTTLLEDARGILAYVRGEDAGDISALTHQMIDGRKRQIGNYSDEYHIDFDDGLSHAMPYEACAIIGLCNYYMRDAPSRNHPALGLPSAQVPDLSTAQLSFQDSYAAFLAKRG